MYDTVKRLFLTGKIDAETGLKNAVLFKWITEEERDAILAEKLQEDNPDSSGDSAEEEPKENE